MTRHAAQLAPRQAFPPVDSAEYHVAAPARPGNANKLRSLQPLRLNLLGKIGKRSLPSGAPPGKKAVDNNRALGARAYPGEPATRQDFTVTATGPARELQQTHQQPTRQRAVIATVSIFFSSIKLWRRLLGWIPKCSRIRRSL